LLGGVRAVLSLPAASLGTGESGWYGEVSLLGRLWRGLMPLRATLCPVRNLCKKSRNWNCQLSALNPELGAAQQD